MFQVFNVDSRRPVLRCACLAVYPISSLSYLNG
jgi:hypothetical protein